MGIYAEYVCGCGVPLDDYEVLGQQMDHQKERKTIFLKALI